MCRVLRHFKNKPFYYTSNWKLALAVNQTSSLWKLELCGNGKKGGVHIHLCLSLLSALETLLRQNTQALAEGT